MSVQMVLLPVFVLVGLTFFLLLWMATVRTRALKSRETSLKDIALRQPNWPEKATQVANCFSNQFEIPVLFYVLIALALPLRHADLFIVRAGAVRGPEPPDPSSNWSRQPGLWFKPVQGSILGPFVRRRCPRYW